MKDGTKFYSRSCQCLDCRGFRMVIQCGTPSGNMDPRDFVSVDQPHHEDCECSGCLNAAKERANDQLD